MLIDRRFCKDVADIAKISLPAQTRTYFPVGHAEFRNRVVERFEKIGRGVEDEGYYLKNDGDVMLGMMVMESRTKQEEETPLTVLVRNSYDKTHSAGIASGPSVFYCLNMCISGSDVSYLRKHTKNVWRDLNVILDEVVSTSENRYQERLDEIEKLTDLPISDTSGYEILGHLAGLDILKPRMFSAALREWKEPSFDVFAERNAWSLYNAVTWGIKQSSPVHVTAKNPLAHDFFSALISDN